MSALRDHAWQVLGIYVVLGIEHTHQLYARQASYLLYSLQLLDSFEDNCFTGYKAFCRKQLEPKTFLGKIPCALLGFFSNTK